MQTTQASSDGTNGAVQSRGGSPIKERDSDDSHSDGAVEAIVVDRAALRYGNGPLLNVDNTFSIIGLKLMYKGTLWTVERILDRILCRRLGHPGAGINTAQVRGVPLTGREDDSHGNRNGGVNAVDDARCRTRI
ncbi:hypothetical protein VKT23_011953 [Stygiomarasmius scandens]|uniref:Uncharacterized protein n=1 Tax=Marasmiellus scandens TaxID=2682957 RepID=A0ABR1JA23_9AGAR